MLFFKAQIMIFVVHFFYVFIVSILLPSAVIAKVDTAEKGVMLEKLSFSFMPYLTARTLREMYTPLVNYLAQQVNIEIEFRIPGDYVEHNRLIGEDQVDITLVGGCLM